MSVYVEEWADLPEQMGSIDMTRHFNVRRGPEISVTNGPKYVESIPAQPPEHELDRGKVRRNIERRLHKRELKKILSDDWDQY